MSIFESRFQIFGLNLNKSVLNIKTGGGALKYEYIVEKIRMRRKMGKDR